MKKIYTGPTILVENIGGILLLANSKGVKGVMNNNPDEIIIDYGGVDDEGNLDPSSNGNSVWNDDK